MKICIPDDACYNFMVKILNKSSSQNKCVIVIYRHTYYLLTFYEIGFFFLFTRNFFFIKYNDFILLPGDSILAISLNINSIGFLHFGIDFVNSITSDYLCWNICQVVESDIRDSVYIGIQCTVLKIQFIDFFHLF